MKENLKWSSAQPIKKADNIISSKARETGNVGFTPSYLSDPTEYMSHIMSNEYMRIWFKERGKFERDTYSREQIIKEESKIKRRYVQRMMTYKKPTKNKFIDEYAEGKLLKNQDDKADYSKFKYKPACSKTHTFVAGKFILKSGQFLKKEEENSDCGDTKNEIVCELEPVPIRSSQCCGLARPNTY